MLAADLHIHTSCSKDGESTLDEILAAASAAGLDLIAITDHDTTAAVALAEQISTEILIIPGVEVSTAEGHLLLLGISETPAAGSGILETIAWAHERGAIAILPHPFHRYRHGAGIKCPEAIVAADAIEVYNSRYIFGAANRKALRWARRYNKGIVAGSDAHNAKYVGFGRTLIDAEKTIPSVLHAIKTGKTKPAGRKTPVRAYTTQSLKNSWRKIRRRVNR